MLPRISIREVRVTLLVRLIRSSSRVRVRVFLVLLMECMTFFFAELALMHYSMVMYCPSMVAASAVYAAHCTLNKTPPWTKTLQYHTGFSEPQLRECAELMVGFHSSARDGKLTVIYRKYSKEELGGVALRFPATTCGKID
ncbi:Cyclin-B1-5 [Platanthera guangdongensis]|uniref:Cyclin-B1-5 n=1 Tax=Platanthera guangdongensis TaxID=2320717 RepID=A0ABR2LPL1_9ASPA